MHDLNTINRLNAQALGKAAEHLRAQGRWVILRKTGLHFTAVESFSTHQEAMNAYLHIVDKTIPGESTELLAPTPPVPGSGLDATAAPPRLFDDGDDFPEPGMGPSTPAGNGVNPQDC